jgi:hypothetical protein
MSFSISTSLIRNLHDDLIGTLDEWEASQETTGL